MCLYNNCSGPQVTTGTSLNWLTCGTSPQDTLKAMCSSVVIPIQRSHHLQSSHMWTQNSSQPCKRVDTISFESGHGQWQQTLTVLKKANPLGRISKSSAPASAGRKAGGETVSKYCRTLAILLFISSLLKMNLCRSSSLLDSEPVLPFTHIVDCDHKNIKE